MSNAGGVRIDDLIDQAQTGVVESEAQIRLRVRVCTSEFGAVGGSVLGCVRVCTCCVCVLITYTSSAVTNNLSPLRANSSPALRKSSVASA